MKIVDYKLITHYDLNTLTNMVKEAIKQGWQPHGGMSISDRETNDKFVQTMVKKISIKESNLEQELRKKSRCCGRCNGIDDICVADDVCDDHQTTGCRICWPDPE